MVSHMTILFRWRGDVATLKKEILHQSVAYTDYSFITRGMHCQAQELDCGQRFAEYFLRNSYLVSTTVGIIPHNRNGIPYINLTLRYLAVNRRPDNISVKRHRSTMRDP